MKRIALLLLLFSATLTAQVSVQGTNIQIGSTPGATGPQGPVGPTGPPGTITADSVTGGFTVPGALTAQSINGVQNPIGNGTGDICTRIAASIALLPSNGGTVDVRGLTSIGTTISCASNPFAANNAAVTPKSIHLILGPGIIQTSVAWIIRTSGITVEGAGRNLTALQYVGTTAITAPDGGHGAVLMFYPPGTAVGYNAPQLGFEKVSGMFFLGTDAFPTATPDGLMFANVQRGLIEDVGAWTVSDSGIVTLGLVTSTPIYNAHVSQFANWVTGITTVRPNIGINLAGKENLSQITEMTVLDPVVEFTKQCGIALEYTHGIRISTGLLEQSDDHDLCINRYSPAGSTQNLVVDSTDFEVTPHAIYDNGLSNVFVNVTLQNAGDTHFAGNRALIIGGQLKDVFIDSSAVNTTFKGSNFLSVPSDSGTQTMFDSQNYYYSGAGLTSVYQWSSKNQTRLGVTAIQSPQKNPKTTWQGAWSFVNSTPTIIDPSTAFLDPSVTAWKLLLMGEFVNNSGSGTHAQTPSLVELSSTNPTYTDSEGYAITFGISGQKLYGATSGSNVMEFIGTMIFTPAAQNTTVNSPGIEVVDAIKIGGGLPTKIACFKADGKTMGYATMAGGDISACN